ncbi:MAG: phosphodiesterase [Oscillospiraceae bacterium]|nr:phosphodiesterase [Oscillospiraceae bacterium]
MKILIASDIHGSVLYCRELLEAYAREGAEKLLILGDILYHGPRNDLPEGYAPKEVIDLLNPVKNELLCVRGNCDTEVDQMVLQFPILSDSCLLYLDGRTVFATHGHHFNPQTPPMLKKGDILLNGHTHVPKCEPAGDFIYLNPGSVSIPKEGSTHQYILWDDGTILFKAMDGTVLRTVTPAELDAMIG